MIRKIFKAFVLTCGVIAMTSCSSDNDQLNNQPPAENFLLVKKVTQTTHYSGTDQDTDVTDFIYQGNQLVKTHTVGETNSYDALFHYNGLKLTSVDYLENNVADGLTTIFYNGDVIDHTLAGINQDERTNYTYSGGHVATMKTYYPEGPTAELLQSRSYTYVNNNIAEDHTSNFFFGNYEYRETYTYDNKKSPFRGLNPYLQQLLANEGFNGLSINNPVSKMSYEPINETTPESQYYVMEYNINGYPTSIKRYYSNGDFLVSETTIEYY